MSDKQTQPKPADAAPVTNVTIQMPDKAAEGAANILEGQRLRMDEFGDKPAVYVTADGRKVDPDGKPVKGDS